MHVEPLKEKEELSKLIVDACPNERINPPAKAISRFKHTPRYESLLCNDLLLTNSVSKDDVACLEELSGTQLRG